MDMLATPNVHIFTPRAISETELYQHEVYPLITNRLMMMGIDINSWIFSNFTIGNTQYCKKPFLDGNFKSKYHELVNMRLRINAQAKKSKWYIKSIEIYNIFDTDCI